MFIHKAIIMYNCGKPIVVFTGIQYNTTEKQEEFLRDLTKGDR